MGRVHSGTTNTQPVKLPYLMVHYEKKQLKMTRIDPIDWFDKHDKNNNKKTVIKLTPYTIANLAIHQF